MVDQGRKSASIARLGVLMVLAWIAGCEGLDSHGSEQLKPVYLVAGQGSDRAQPQGRVTVKGVVSGEFLGEDQLNGFFIQGLESAPDGKPAGLFVYAPQIDEFAAEKVAALEQGRVVRITGQAGEFHGRPQLSRIESIEIKGKAPLESYELAWPAQNKWRFEGVHVTIAKDMLVSGNYKLSRFGSLKLTPERRAFRPTNFAPGDGPEQPRLRGQRLILDDGSYSWYPDPIPYLNDDNTRRVGSRVKELSGVLTHAFEQWRIHPTEEPTFKDSNLRPQPLAEPAAEEVRVAAFNVENYFLTLGERGASSQRELEFQRAKLIAAASYLNADILALVEMENRADAPEDLVERLSKATDQPWELVRDPEAGSADAGSDAIKVSIAYRADRVKRVGEAQRDRAEVHHRPPLLAVFRASGGEHDDGEQQGEPFAVAAIHFKAKVGCPESGDIDRGQGCWNLRRKEQAEALIEFIRAWQEENDDIPVLIAGDLNAYGDEDPARVLASAAKVDLLAEHIAWPQRYTYVFRGESGYLDHLQAAPRLAERVTAVHTLPINADEPRFLEFDDGGPRGRYRDSSPFRSSDHDPIAVDLRQ
ncbi:ExeM/NucH family extracellular endonuclease [Halorhodospira halochloris]|uniref:ExeM/NucH family extracellular endonuclease n=1 Tax=Halorhodospira halochloris TaxID=1052 RepID=UPI001EE85D36|nr:ExeM/NucH family extracellular endonuclease [Halorhodospira halochloris]